MQDDLFGYMSSSYETALAWANTWARLQGHDSIDAVALLVGVRLAHGDQSQPVELLRHFEIPLAVLDQALGFGKGELPSQPSGLPSPDQFTGDAETIIRLSRDLAARSRSERVHLRHLFGALLMEATPASSVLQSALKTAPFDELVTSYADFLAGDPNLGYDKFLDQRFPKPPSSNTESEHGSTTDRGDDAKFVHEEDEVPDGTVLQPNQGFAKTWVLSNTGQTTWDDAYRLVLIDGAALGAPQVAPVPFTPPGKTVKVTMSFVAPTEPGSHHSVWQLVNAAGLGFGEKVWAEIIVQDSSKPLVPNAYTPPSPGYIADYVDPNATLLMDRLDIEQEVTTIAHVLMSGQVQPPLSLGLFGDWGSGKTFFMTSLKNRIDDVARHYRAHEKLANKRSDWCTRVVQITFNAWHFSDSNLWASIVTRIYDELDRTLQPDQPSDEELRKNLGKQIQSAQGMVRQTESEVELAKTRVGAAETKLRETQVQLRESQNTVSGLIDDLEVLLRDNEPVRKELDTATSALGYPEAARSFSSLVELHGSLQTISGRTSALAISLVRAPWTLLVLAALVIGLPLLLSWVMTQFADSIGAVGRSVVEISTVVVALVAWLQRQIGKGLSLIGSVEGALADARTTREKRINEEQVVQDARKNLLEAEASEKAARDNLVSAQAELQRLERELQELRPERKLFKLIEERSQSAAYSKHLGIVSLIRSDFEQMSVLLARMKDEERNLTDEEPPIQRIILYIDDLDRCRPERVVEVLEAVHLLLAFPLFVVVVGVDPRWLRHSLSHHYSQTLAETGAPLKADNRVGPAIYSTPQDYLEKIFQIPYALRPIDRVGFTSLVTDLLKPLPGRVTAPAESTAIDSNAGQHLAVATIETTGAPIGGSQLPAGQPAHEIPEQRTVAQPGSEPTDASAPLAAPAISTDPAPLPFARLNPAQLEFEAWENDDILRLWPLFRTPRSAKRFVNIYRLLRAGLSSEQEVERFVGSPDQPGDYQIVLVLLAVIAASPNQADRFLGQIKDSAAARPTHEGDAGNWHWKDFFEWRSASAPGEQIEVDVAWEILLQRVQLVTSSSFTQPANSVTLMRWAARVARYSFSVSTAEGA